MAAPTDDELRQLVKQGKAMPAPGQDRPGRFYVRNRADLENAVRAVGEVKGGDAARAQVRRFIVKRAREMNLLNCVPDTWMADGSLKQH